MDHSHPRSRGLSFGKGRRLRVCGESLILGKSVIRHTQDRFGKRRFDLWFLKKILIRANSLVVSNVWR